MKNVDLMLTTHFIDLCSYLNENKKIVNKKMKVNVLGNREFEYVYKLDDGISEIKGGVKVLKDLQYPVSIIMRSENILDIS
jgi:DNA mismatch repair ATPase MutS